TRLRRCGADVSGVIQESPSLFYIAKVVVSYGGQDKGERHEQDDADEEVRQFAVAECECIH
ncbi:hypothetical protein, partial [Bacteroides heparinolyticus]|uniref:hypothetical protein n=1 Tax=Prevotella heparinolytica TaxID=28113 RepID=UPI0035A1483F